MLPFKSLDAATGTGTGAIKDLESSLSTHTMIILVSGSPTSLDIRLRGSHDGTNWMSLGAISSAPAGIQRITAENAVVRYVRADIDELSGGTSPTVTATIASTS